MSKSLPMPRDPGPAAGVQRCSACGLYFGDAPLARITEHGCLRCGSLLPSEATVTEHLAEIKPNVLSVHADVTDLLERFDGDEAKLFDFLGKLKDLLA